MIRQAMPTSTIETEPYWDGIKAGELRIPECTTCGTMHFYPKPRCPNCGARDFVWRAVSGEGTVYAHTAVHRAPSALFAEDVPYVIGLIRLTEGPHMMSRLINVDPAEDLAERRVRLRVVPDPEGQVLPLFEVIDDVE